MRHKKELHAGRFVLPFADRTFIMGVMNITPDSFSQDGRLRRSGKTSDHARFATQLIKSGADILDIGGESTRPGALAVTAKDELKRILPLIQILAPRCPIPISIDTYKPDVAKECLAVGASIINNVMGTKLNKTLLISVKKHDAAIVLMHSRGNPRTMQKKIVYKDIVGEIIAELRQSIEFCLEIGIKEDRIIVDPGIGFAKTPLQNLQILNRLSEMSKLRLPILVGTSRKSFIGQVLDAGVKDREWGTAASVCASIINGANIVRVHNVAAMKQVATVTDAIIYAR